MPACRHCNGTGWIDYLPEETRIAALAEAMGAAASIGGIPVIDGKVDRKGAAQLVRVTPQTLKNYATELTGPVFVRSGRRVSYELTELARWSLARESEPLLEG